MRATGPVGWLRGRHRRLGYPPANVLDLANSRHRIRRSLIRPAPGIPADTIFRRLRHAYVSLLDDAGPQLVRAARPNGRPDGRHPRIRGGYFSRRAITTEEWLEYCLTLRTAPAAAAQPTCT